MTLLGWSTPLLPDVEEAVRSGHLTVIHVTDKWGTYELLRGEFHRGPMMICFK